MGTDENQKELAGGTGPVCLRRPRKATDLGSLAADVHDVLPQNTSWNRPTTGDSEERWGPSDRLDGQWVGRPHSTPTTPPTVRSTTRDTVPTVSPGEEKGEEVRRVGTWRNTPEGTGDQGDPSESGRGWFGLRTRRVDPPEESPSGPDPTPVEEGSLRLHPPEPTRLRRPPVGPERRTARSGPWGLAWYRQVQETEERRHSTPPVSTPGDHIPGPTGTVRGEEGGGGCPTSSTSRTRRDASSATTVTVGVRHTSHGTVTTNLLFTRDSGTTGYLSHPDG